jgi:hypothetical protein
VRRLISSVRVASAVLALAALLALLTPLTLSGREAPSQTARAGVASTLPHLHGIDEIRDWFNAGKGHARLILLLSPT